MVLRSQRDPDPHPFLQMGTQRFGQQVIVGAERRLGESDLGHQPIAKFVLFQGASGGSDSKSEGWRTVTDSRQSGAGNMGTPGPRTRRRSPDLAAVWGGVRKTRAERGVIVDRSFYGRGSDTCGWAFSAERSIRSITVTCCWPRLSAKNTARRGPLRSGSRTAGQAGRRNHGGRQTRRDAQALGRLASLVSRRYVGAFPSGVSYTVDSLRRLREELPEAEIFFLMGGDSLGGIPDLERAGRDFEAGDSCRRTSRLGRAARLVAPDGSSQRRATGADPAKPVRDAPRRNQFDRHSPAACGGALDPLSSTRAVEEYVLAQRLYDACAWATRDSRMSLPDSVTKR